MMYAISTVETADGKYDEFLQQVKTIIGKARAREGCLDFSVSVDHDVLFHAFGLAPRDEIVTVVAKWDSADHMEKGVGDRLLAEFIDRNIHLLKQVNTRFLKVVE